MDIVDYAIGKPGSSLCLVFLSEMWGLISLNKELTEFKYKNKARGCVYLSVIIE